MLNTGKNVRKTGSLNNIWVYATVIGVTSWEEQSQICQNLKWLWPRNSNVRNLPYIRTYKKMLWYMYKDVHSILLLEQIRKRIHMFFNKEPINYISYNQIQNSYVIRMNCWYDVISKVVWSMKKTKDRSMITCVYRFHICAHMKLLMGINSWTVRE